jgi:hypothetical protein
MNQITIWEPRWHDRTVLIADRRLLAHNEIIIEHKDFPAPFYLTAERARSFPLEQMSTKTGGTIAVRAIPLAELEREVIDGSITSGDTDET